MISEIKIQNFKSIKDLKLKLGRVTVLIGENGSGKSNILEAIAFAGCASVDKLDNEYLAPRGIRVTDDTWMVSAFPETNIETKDERGIEFKITGNDESQSTSYSVLATRHEDDNSFSRWRFYSPQIGNGKMEGFLGFMGNFAEPDRRKMELTLERFKTQFSTTPKLAADAQSNLEDIKTIIVDLEIQLERQKLADLAIQLGLSNFVIFAPENTTLRLPPPEGAIQPLGTKGEGLFRLLQSFADEKLDEKFKGRLTELQSRLQLFGWFDKFLPPDDSATNQARLQIHDRWLAPDKAVFDQRSANEGFLYVLFYFTLLMSWRTPIFFAIDNVDTALNPKLCSTLMEQIIELAKKYDKQVICTTHNPAILDGLNLKDDDQRLYTVSRDGEGHTRVRRVTAPEPQRSGELPVRLSEAFQRGIIGGLPNNF